MCYVQWGLWTGFVLFVAYTLTKKEPEQRKSSKRVVDPTSVSQDDIKYIASHLTPTSTRLQILAICISTPENILWSELNIEKLEKIKEERAAQDRKDAESDFGDLLDNDGWAEDDDDEEEEQDAAKKEDAKRLENLKIATGQKKTLLEDVDEGVLGQKWVVSTLEKAKLWPPTDLLDHLAEINITDPLDNPALNRILCMTSGRLNSNMLNTHPQLLEAGSKRMIDQTYFNASMEFRQRISLLLEASLRIGLAFRSYTLTKTILETIVLFKQGSKEPDLPKFQAMMQKQYGALPVLKISESGIGNEGNQPIRVGDKPTLQLKLERLHAEAFTKAKIAQFKQQGIPPQVGLQTYREGWWFLLRVNDNDDDDTPDLSSNLGVSATRLASFADNIQSHNRILTAFPLMVTNVAQKAGGIKMPFDAPKVPGQYTYKLAVISQDFLGANVQVEFHVTVLGGDKDKDNS